MGKRVYLRIGELRLIKGVKGNELTYRIRRKSTRGTGGGGNAGGERRRGGGGGRGLLISI